MSEEQTDYSLAEPTLSLASSEDLIREMLRRIGEDPHREGLEKTPVRVVRSWGEIFGGYRIDPKEVLGTTFSGDGYDEMVLLKDIEFYSTCMHHLQPIVGVAHIAYLPTDKIVGLSKLARVLDIYAQRLQVQENITVQVANALQEFLNPKGVAVVLEAKHFCMCARGVRKQNSVMFTSCLTGSFKENPATRSEFYSAIGKRM